MTNTPPVQLEMFDDYRYPCDRCEAETEAPETPHRFTTALWCESCRECASLCVGCGDEIDPGSLDCPGCRAYTRDVADHYGDDR